jgi:general secretion pathway protein D
MIMTGSRGNRMRTLARTTCLLPFFLICGCAAFPALETTVSRPGARVATDVSEGPDASTTTGSEGTRPERLQIPSTAGPATPARVPATAAQIEALLSDDPIDANLAPQSIPQFAATVFGGILGVPYTLTADVSTRTEILSGGTGGTLTKRNLFRLTQQALRQYGIEVYIENGFVTVGASQTSDIGATLTRGRESPDGGGRVVQFFAVQTIEVNAIQALLRDLFPNLGGARITVDQLSNSLIVSGSTREVQQVIRVLREIDQPRFAGADVLRVEPVYLPAEALATALDSALVTEGYIVSRQPLAGRSIVILSFPSSSQLLIFTKDPVLLERVEFWLQQLDRMLLEGVIGASVQE